MRVAVVTVAAGRHDHLRGQLEGLASSTVPRDLHVIVSMGDPVVADVARDAGSDALVVGIDASGTTLPIARARNLGADIALEDGADVLIFLDVDCIPGRDLIARYCAAASRTGDSLLCGPVTYLPPRASSWDIDDLARHTDPHAARPNPPAGTIERGTNFDLFWSLSFAVTAQTWRRTGTFCEEYSGYGGEDTDFAATAEASGIDLRWIGGAHAYHQHHPVSSPPVEHLADIVRNSVLFHRRWNRWPMEGWLAEFERTGTIERFDDGTIRLVR